MDLKYQIDKAEYNYLVYMLLVKIIGFLQLNESHIEEQEINIIIDQLNSFFSKRYIFDKSNIIKLGKEIIDDNFPRILEQMKNLFISPEIILSKNKFNQIKENFL